MEQTLELDEHIAEISHLLQLARECGFRAVAALIEQDIAETHLPLAMGLMALADGEDRAVMARRCARLRELLT
jgi:hypothetical protein